MADRARLPNFLVIGAMKAGTTSLYHYLRLHPQVFMPKIKELDFFTGGSNWRRGIEWYARQFASAEAGAISLGEASTAYTKYPHYPDVPERIVKQVPDTRLVYLVRDPIDRIRSHYQHRVAVGAETEPMERALLENPIYVDYSCYAMQIERYLPHFPHDRLLIVTSEGLRYDRLATIRRLYEFLRVDPGYVPPTLDREFYRTEGRPVYPSALWSVRRAVRRWFPAAKRAKELVDSLGMGVAGRTRGTRGEANGIETNGGEAPGASAGADLPAALRRMLEDRLRDDVSRLRTYIGPAFEGWGIA